MRPIIKATLIALLLQSTLASASDDCQQQLDHLDRQYTRQGLTDTLDTPVAGFHHLRTNRWLAFLQSSLQPALQTFIKKQRNDDAQQQWLALSAARATESWQRTLERADASVQTRQHVTHCLQALLSRTDFYAVPMIEIPDSYRTWQRVLGVYPITRWFAQPSINRYYREMDARFVSTASPPVAAFKLTSDKPTTPAATPGALADNPLRIPIPSDEQFNGLLHRHAPIIETALKNENNLPGTVSLVNGNPVVDTGVATAYVWPSWTHLAGENLLQLNYQFWFTRRPSTGRFDIYAGELDSLIWRVTLAQDGHVLFYDSIHSCGCYHKVFLVDESLSMADIRGDKPVVYPTYLSSNLKQGNAQRRLLLAPDTHYLVRVDEPRAQTRTAYDYRLAPAAQLFTLQDNQGVANLHDQKGIIRLSRRPERWLLWPLGVPSAGAMRQPGQHATAFIGRRHFDDPLLGEMLFNLRE